MDVLIDEYRSVEMPSQANVKSIVAYVKVGKFGIFNMKLVTQLSGNPTSSLTSSKDGLTWIKASII